MKKFLLMKAVALLFVVACAQVARAQHEMQCFAVEYTSGETYYFALDAEPIVSYADGTISVTQEGDGAFSIEGVALSDIARNYFAQAIPEGIGKVPTMDGETTEFSNGKALITGLKDGAQVYVYSADGQVVGSVVARDGNACVDFNGLKGGQVYILSTPSGSVKIVK